MFDLDGFVADCQTALTEHTPQLAMKELIERSMASPAEVRRALGLVERAEIVPLLRSPELTVLKAIWAPGMTIYPHDHRMWAVIGIYGGEEDNTFYRRGAHGLMRTGGKVLLPGDATLLGEDVIHAVTNPRSTFTESIHVYGGDLFATPRSEWDPETLEERPYDVEKVLRYFLEQNERLTVG